jgi:hypothetical protein
MRCGVEGVSVGSEGESVLVRCCCTAFGERQCGGTLARTRRHSESGGETERRRTPKRCRDFETLSEILAAKPLPLPECFSISSAPHVYDVFPLC